MVSTPEDSQPARLTLRDLSRAVRTRQWAKNALLFAGFIFAGHLRLPPDVVLAEVTRVLLAFVCFCALSGAAYLINDWHDLPNDRLHPIKCKRPMAAGRLSTRAALTLIIGLLVLATGCGLAVWRLHPDAWGLPLTAVAYFALTLSYSFFLKHEVIVDVISIAAGFVLRVIAGCVAVPVDISPWIIFCTFTLALFIALCKRRAELLEVGAGGDTRRVLTQYNLPMLDTLIAVASGLTITAYSLYTFNAQQSTALSPTLHHSLLMSTIPFVVYGVFRYLFLAHKSPVGGEPEQMLRDVRMMVNMALWAIVVALLTLLK